MYTTKSRISKLLSVKKTKKALKDLGYMKDWHGYDTKLNPLVHFQRLSTLKLMFEGSIKLLDVGEFGK